MSYRYSAQKSPNHNNLQAGRQAGRKAGCSRTLSVLRTLVETDVFMATVFVSGAMLD